jgi:hypothetical protein
MPSLVTVAIPIYKRLHYLAEALRAVQAQDYPCIELIVSDNGLNGEKVREIVDQCYFRPCTLRSNPVSVRVSIHHQQLVEAASGEYFVFLPDDDAMSPNYVSELVSVMERNPKAALAMAAEQLIVDPAGHVVRGPSVTVPDVMTGEDLIRRWTVNGVESYTPIMARTADIKRCGGYPDFPWGTCSDSVLLVKLCLGREVAFSKRCSYRLRIDDASHGWSLPCGELAKDLRAFFQFLDSDADLQAYAAGHRDEWTELRRCMVEVMWQTYHLRWRTMYRERMRLLPWIGAGLALPFIPGYYRQVAMTLNGVFRELLVSRVKRSAPRLYESYRRAKQRRTNAM